MFAKLLIANRGEIACRVIRTARRLGIRTVAVYSEADEQALHVEMADEAYSIGPAPARDSYLNISAILEAARRAGAAAVHPGYGFLAENAEIAAACAAAGLVFVGPPASAIRAMGSKSEAKALMERAGVPLVPGYHGADQDEATLEKVAGRIGYPVLIKPSAGGGGKGMRRVDRAGDFAAALAGARREAAASFADERVLIEKYLTHPRHVEMQVFADGFGNIVHLYERECSMQRRHQKVIEEAPSPGMTAERRRDMAAAAIAAARAIGYVGAGTVEFLVEADGRFYFMEMNTRLQVEHPVTEVITGLDLVEWQLRVAAGEALPLTQDDIRASGHAIEARLYAEDPSRDFLPVAGLLTYLRLPAPSAGVRVDAGVRSGDRVSIHYDPLLAKIIASDRDRAGALRRLQAALAECLVVGPASNLDLLAALAAHPAFAAAEFDIGFIDRHRAELIPAPAPVGDRALAVACLYLMLQRAADARAAAARSGDPNSPWQSTDCWRANIEPEDNLRFRAGEREVVVPVRFHAGEARLQLPGGALRVSGAIRASNGPATELRADLSGQRIDATVVRRDWQLLISLDGVRATLELSGPRLSGEAEPAGAGPLAAPMPGKVVQVLVRPGDKVRRGAVLLVLEAMKMEHTIAAPADAVVASVRYAPGDLVEDGAELLTFADAT